MYSSVVPANVNYTWDILKDTVDKLKEKYPFINVSTIGKSVMGKDIFAISAGCGEKKILINASHHANEWITTPLTLKFAEKYCNAYISDEHLHGEKIRRLWNQKTVCIVPMVNPDGVDLVNENIDKDSLYYKNAVKISKDFKDIPFPQGWKANIDGTDLNLNYPAGWARAKEIKYSLGFSQKAPKNYVGDSPLCAPESRAMYNYSIFNLFSLTLSYHTQGKVIYWKYLDYLPENAEIIGRALSKASGYKLDITPVESGFAGYKDWFIKHYNKPGYTIEAGEGENPLPISQFDNIYKDNEALLTVAVSLG